MLFMPEMEMAFQTRKKWSKSTLAIEDNSADADLRLPNITLRNSRVAGYTGVLQVKSSVTQNGWALFKVTL